MIVGVGTDIVAVARIAAVLARHGDRFLARCFSPAERRLARGRDAAGAAALAARWAAREAFLKALGRDVSGVPYGDIAVAQRTGGPPELVVRGRAAAALAAAGGRRLHLSLAHERDYAVATVVIED